MAIFSAACSPPIISRQKSLKRGNSTGSNNTIASQRANSLHQNTGSGPTARAVREISSSPAALGNGNARVRNGMGYSFDRRLSKAAADNLIDNLLGHRRGRNTTTVNKKPRKREQSSSSLLLTRKRSDGTGSTQAGTVAGPRSEIWGGGGEAKADSVHSGTANGSKVSRASASDSAVGGRGKQPGAGPNSRSSQSTVSSLHGPANGQHHRSTKHSASANTVADANGESQVAPTRPKAGVTNGPKNRRVKASLLRPQESKLSSSSSSSSPHVNETKMSEQIPSSSSSSPPHVNKSKAEDQVNTTSNRSTISTTTTTSTTTAPRRRLSNNRHVRNYNHNHNTGSHARPVAKEGETQSTTYASQGKIAPPNDVKRRGSQPLRASVQDLYRQQKARSLREQAINKHVQLQGEAIEVAIYRRLFAKLERAGLLDAESLHATSNPTPTSAALPRSVSPATTSHLLLLFASRELFLGGASACQHAWCVCSLTCLRHVVALISSPF